MNIVCEEFDPAKYCLGKLCRSMHGWKDTGKTLRYKSTGHCVWCNKVNRIPTSPTQKIRNKAEKIEKIFWSKVKIVEENNSCWEWLGAKFKLGYGIFYTNNKNLSAHRFAWELTYGAIPDGLHCLHRCDVRSCVRPSHLWLGTHAENMSDMSQKGRGVTMQGENHKLSKLTEENVRHIRRVYAEGGVSQRQLARMFSVSQGVIKQVILGRTWKHI